MHDIKIKAGDLLKEARKQAKLKQKQVAYNCGMSSSQVSRVERGRIDVSICILDKMLRACGMKIVLSMQPAINSAKVPFVC